MVARALLSTALLLLSALPARGLQPDPTPRDEPGLRGTVVDRETRRPLEGAVVTLTLPEGEAPVRSTLSDAQGRFAFTGIDDGAYQIGLQRVGYRPAEEPVGYRAAMGLRVEVEMVGQAVELEPLFVVTEARSRVLEANGFYERRRRGLGRFVSRDEATHALRVSDIFRTMPGVRMSVTDRFGQDGVVLLRNGCVADVYLDGARTTSPFPVDMVLAPGDLAAVEVYHGSEVPPRFGSAGCGVVVFWTHLPNPGSGEPWSWTKLMVALGVFGGSFLLFR